MIFLLACFTMVLDHIGLLFFTGKDLVGFIPGENELRLIGRISFPLFGWGIVRGYRMTRNKEKYLKRLFLLGIASQIPFLYISVLYQVEIINVIFTLVFGLLSIFVGENIKVFWYFKIIILGFLFGFAEYFHFDYGAYGIGMILLFHIFWQQKITIIYFLLWTLLWYNTDYQNFSFEYHYQIFAPLSVVLLYFTSLQKTDFRLNFYFKYLFYPGHFAILLLIYFLIS